MAADEKSTGGARKKTPSPPSTTAAAEPRVDRAPEDGPPEVDDSLGGHTTIAESVVAKVAGIAARGVSGVYALGSGGARAFGAIRDAVAATDLTQGIKVEVGQTQAAADITIVVDYPAPIQDVAQNVRAAVAEAITRLAGLQVVEVNVDVNDVHLPGEDDGADDAESRVS